jgi:hypothetical protein
MLKNIRSKFAELIARFKTNQNAPVDNISSSDYPDSLASHRKLAKNLSVFFKHNAAIITSLALAVLSIWFFLTITQDSFFTTLPYFRIRWYGLGAFLLSGIATYYGAFWNTHIQGNIAAVTAFAHSFLLTIISYLYLIRLNSDGIAFFNYELNTGLVFIPVSILIFVSNYSVFSRSKHIQLLTVAQALFILLFSYAIIGFIQFDDTFARNFNQGWLSVLFNLPAWIWLLFGSLALSFITSHNIPHPNTEKRILYLSAYYIMNLQILMVMYILNFTYWYQTLLALISWNFIYTNILSLMTKKNDPKYKPRLAISIVYHALLFLIVLYVG